MSDVILPGTAAWYEAKTGSWSASRAPALMSTKTVTAYSVNGEIFPNQTAAAKAAGLSIPKLKKVMDEGDPRYRLVEGVEPSEKYADLIGEVASERLTGQMARHFVTAPMQRGLNMEPAALDAYALDRMVALGQSRLVLHPTMPNVCCTPDGFVAGDGLVQTKVCTVAQKHMDTFTGGKRSLVHEYRDQCLFELWVTGRQWCDLVSFYPEFPQHLQLAVVRIERDEERFAAFEAAIAQAEKAVAEILDTLEAITTGQREATE